PMGNERGLLVGVPDLLFGARTRRTQPHGCRNPRFPAPDPHAQCGDVADDRLRLGLGMREAVSFRPRVQPGVHSHWAVEIAGSHTHADGRDARASKRREALESKIYRTSSGAAPLDVAPKETATQVESADVAEHLA